MGYCEKSDLMLGTVETPRMIDPDAAIESAAEEINLVLAPLYELPLSFPENGNEYAKLFLKKVNRFLASGRILMAASAGNEDGGINVYARYLVKQAEDALAAVASGVITFPGLKANPENKQDYVSGPDIILMDEDSFVREFYNSHGPAPIREIPPEPKVTP